MPKTKTVTMPNGDKVPLSELMFYQWAFANISKEVQQYLQLKYSRIQKEKAE